MAAKLREAVRGAHDLVGRLGGEEFGILLADVDADEAFRVAERARALIRGLPIDGFSLDCSAGVAAWPTDTDTPARLLDLADAALYQAKRMGRGQTRRVDADSGEAAVDQQRAAVRRLLDDPQLITPVFQPIVDLATGRVAGYEGLSRFPAEDGRRPDEWFDLARRCGLGPLLQALALRRLVEVPGRPNRTWLSLNLDAGALATDAVQGALPADLDGIVIEITEQELPPDDEALQRILADLRARGAKIALDDAGAGYAGLQHVVRIRPDIIKLDRSLVRGVDDGRRAARADRVVRGVLRRAPARCCARRGSRPTRSSPCSSTPAWTSARATASAAPAPPWASTAPQVAAAAVPHRLTGHLSTSRRGPQQPADGHGGGGRIPVRLGLRDDTGMLTKILATLSEVTAAKALPVVGVALAAGTATVGATGVTKSTGGERTKIVRDVRADRGAVGARGPVGRTGRPGDQGRDRHARRDGRRRRGGRERPRRRRTASTARPARPARSGAAGAAGAAGLDGVNGVDGVDGADGRGRRRGRRRRRHGRRPVRRGAAGTAGRRRATRARPAPTAPRAPPAPTARRAHGRGATGAKGDTGAAGADGAKGDKGDTGAAGADGAKGDKGDAGAGRRRRRAGTQGRRATRVPTAPRATTGRPGPGRADAGPQGLQGPKGDTGDTGAQGRRRGRRGGRSGSRRPDGPAGAHRPEGRQGRRRRCGRRRRGRCRRRRGRRGRGTVPPGATGAAGAQGTAGATGAAGPKGDKGDTGAAGPEGRHRGAGPQGRHGRRRRAGRRARRAPAAWSPPRRSTSTPPSHIAADTTVAVTAINLPAGSYRLDGVTRLTKGPGTGDWACSLNGDPANSAASDDIDARRLRPHAEHLGDGEHAPDGDAQLGRRRSCCAAARSAAPSAPARRRSSPRRVGAANRVAGTAGASGS